MLLKDRLQEEMKTAMRAQNKPRLGIVRLILAAIKQYEVDERIPAEDPQVITILDKMRKQRYESIQQYELGNRQDLADQERYEIKVIEEFLPRALSVAEIDQLIEEAMATTSAKGIQDMGKVMAQLKPQLSGRADMAMVGAKIKERLS